MIRFEWSPLFAFTLVGVVGCDAVPTLMFVDDSFIQGDGGRDAANDGSGETDGSGPRKCNDVSCVGSGCTRSCDECRAQCDGKICCTRTERGKSEVECRDSPNDCWR